MEQDLYQDCWLLIPSWDWFFPCPRPSGSSPSLSTAFSDNPSVLSELCSTLSRLAVRNEFCQEIVDLGGLGVLVALLANCSDHQVGVQAVLGCEAPFTWISICHFS